MNNIAERVKSRMDELKIGQAELAKLCDVSQQAISDLVNGKISKPRFLLALAEALKLSPKWIGTGQGEKEIKNHYEMLPPTVVSDNKNFSYGQDIPVLEYKRNPNGSLLLMAQATTTPAYPEQIGYENCFAIEADGQMKPRYRDMEKIHISRNKRPRIGKDCFIEMKNGDWFLKQFMETTVKDIICRELNNDKEWRRPLADIKAMHEVAGRD